MAKHVIRVQYLESQGTIDNIIFSDSANNLSSEALNDLKNVNVYTDGFLLNLSDLSGKYEYYSNNGVKYYISNKLSDENGNIDISLYVTSSNAKAISLVFSKEYYPTKILVNNVEYDNTDDSFQVFVNEEAANVLTTIKFTKMNVANAPLIITNINTGISIDYNDDYIINIISGSQLSTDNDLPKYELVAQYGSCSFVDNDYVVLNLKEKNILRKPKKIEFLLDNNIIGTYKVESWDYNTSNNVVEIDLIDNIDELEDILINPKEPEYIEPQYIEGSQGDWYMYTAKDLFEEIKSMIVEFGETFDDLDSSITEWFESIKIKVKKYKASNIMDLVNEFCNFTQTSFYKKRNGKIGVYLWR